MKAFVCTRYGSPEVLQLKEVDTPVPKPHEVLVKICATTVTVADFRIRSFTIPLSFWIPARLILGIRKPRKPILGVELAGIVESVGDKVTRFKKGDRIFAATLSSFGAYAEFTCIPEDAAMAIMPVNSSFEEAAAIPIGARTALHYLRSANLMQGQKVLIYGASGSVGTYAVQLAKHFGAEVTGVCSASNVALVKSLGAHRVLDYSAIDFIQQLEMYDVIFVAVDKIPFAVCNACLKPSGIYLNVTTPVKSIHMNWISATSKKKIIVGHNPSEKSEDLVFIKTLVEKEEVKPVIDKIYPFDQMVEAHRYVGQGHKKGNVAITVLRKG